MIFNRISLLYWLKVSNFAAIWCYTPINFYYRRCDSIAALMSLRCYTPINFYYRRFG